MVPLAVFRCFVTDVKKTYFEIYWLHIIQINSKVYCTTELPNTTAECGYFNKHNQQEKYENAALTECQCNQIGKNHLEQGKRHRVISVTANKQYKTKNVHAVNAIARTTASITPQIYNTILITLRQLTTNDSVKWAHPIWKIKQ